MTTTICESSADSGTDSQICWLDGEMAEISLLLPGWEAAELERLAGSRGLTFAQLVRLILRNHLRLEGAQSHDGRKTSVVV